MAEPFVLNALVNLQGFAAGSIAKLKEEMQHLSGSIDFGSMAKIGKIKAPAIKSVKDFAAVLTAASQSAAALETKMAATTSAIVANFKAATAAVKEFNLAVGKVGTGGTAGVALTPKTPVAGGSPKKPQFYDQTIMYGPAHGKNISPNAILAQAQALKTAAANVQAAAQAAVDAQKTVLAQAKNAVPAAPNAMLGQFGPASGKKPIITGGSGKINPATGAPYPAPAPPPAPNAMLGQFAPATGKKPIITSGGGKTNLATGAPYPTPAAPQPNMMLGQFGPPTGKKPIVTGGGSGGGNAANNMKAGAKAASDFSDSMLLAGKRYAAFVGVTAGLFKAWDGLKAGTQAVIEFDSTITRLNQTLDPTKSELEGIKGQIIDLSIATGTSVKELGDIAVTLAQAGYKGSELKTTLDALAQVPLLPSFESAGQATEALIAIQGQFKMGAEDTIPILDKLNQLSNDYAITSTDLGEAVKRGGGAWAALGGTLEQYLAVVTAVRQRTQESAEAIGTALRTISGMIGRDKTLAFLESMGVQTKDSEGKMLGLYHLLKNISEVYQRLPDQDRRQLVDKIGGARQAGRVISILENFDLVEKALRTAQTSAGSMAQDAAKGLDSLSKQFSILVNKAEAFIQKLAPETFTPFLKFLISAGSLAVSLAEKLSPVISLLAKLGAAAAVIGGVGLLGKFGAKVLPYLGSGAIPQVGGAVGVNGAALGGGLLGRLGLGAAASTPVSGLLGAGGVAGVGKAALNGVTNNSWGQMGALAAFTLVVPGLVQSLGGLIETTNSTRSSFSKMAADFLSTSAAVVGVLAILQGQSIGQTLKGPFGSLIPAKLKDGSVNPIAGTLNAASIGGLVLTTLAVSAARRMEQAIAEKLDEVSAEIKRIKVPNTQQEAEKALGELMSKIAQGLRAAGEEQSGVSGYLGRLGNRLSNFAGGVVSGDWNRALRQFSFDKPAMDDAKKIIDQLIGSNLELLNGILEQAIREGGMEFRGGFYKSISDLLRSLGFANPEGWSKYVGDQFLKQAGGAGGLKGIMEHIQQQGLAYGQAMETAREALMKLVPPKLITDMTNLGRAVERAVKTIDASIAAFDSTRGVIDQITPPQLPTKIDKEAAEKLLASGQLYGLPGLTPEMQGVAWANKELNDLAYGYVSAIGKAQEDALARKAAGGNPEMPLEGANVGRGIDEYLDKAGAHDEIRPTARLMLGDLAELTRKGLEGDNAGPNKAGIDAIIGNYSKVIAPNAAELAGNVGNQLGAMFRHANKYMEIEASQLKRRVSGQVLAG